ncbi:hypothetical protein ACJJTC_013980 [Scirpophaga incertulas]
MSNANQRIAPKEMIITRTKSAQQKRQLRDKDRSMTKITQLLKSPQSSKTKKRSKNPTIKTEKVESERVEYHPDKLRRRIEQKRVFLRPHYVSRTVVKLNKRKNGTPQKNFLTDAFTPEDPDSRSRSPVFSELSMEEIVRIVEETETLDDEDLMEILTCPSPVWWEEPPDESYVEEAIFKRELVNTKKQKRPKAEMVKRNPKEGKKQMEMAIITKIETKPKTDVNFAKKQNKLENLLGNIKNKAKPKKAYKQNGEHHKFADKLDTNANRMMEDGQKRINNSVNKRKNNNLSESNDSETDPSLHEDALLIDLENIDIPMETDNSNKKHATEIENKSTLALAEAEMSTDVIILEKYGEETEQRDDSYSTCPITKRPKLNEMRSPSDISYSDKSDISSVSGQENCDTISDTNIKFIADEDIDFDCDEKEVTTDAKCTGKDKKDSPLDAKFLKIYRIDQNDKGKTTNKFKNIPEYSTYVQKLMKHDASDETKYDGQLNSFFKKCKNANRKRKKETETKADVTKKAESQLCDCDPKRSTISIAQDDNVKYCLNCSSIFDTEECSYCLNSKQEENSDVQILAGSLT